MLIILSQLSDISPVVLQLLPKSRAQVAASSTPHSHMEKKIGLPVLKNKENDYLNQRTHTHKIIK